MDRLKQATFVIISLLFLSLVITIFLIPLGYGVDAMQNYQAGLETPTATGFSGTTGLDAYVFAQAPDGDVSDPYVILTAFANTVVPINIGVEGILNQIAAFTCSTTPCKLPINTDSTITFHAVDNGQTSQNYSTIVRISESANGAYQVSVNTSPVEATYTDACYSIWDSPEGGAPGWAAMPISPLDLNTDQTLYYLSNALIQNKIVDTSSCPSGGMADGSPNGCGMEQSRNAMIAWENSFDLDIWRVSKSIGLPPELLKTLILEESQFWPANARYIMNEIGLGQINDLGADVALRWDRDLYTEVCSSVLSDCSSAYVSLPFSMRAMVRGALLARMNMECPTCQYGFDANIAHASIYTIGRVVRANCWESWYVLDQNNVKASYEDYWKFTMASYHSGYGCLDQAISATKKARESIDWEHVSEHFACADAKQYVDNFWGSLNAFNSHIIAPTIAENAIVTAVQRATPSPYPTLSPSTASLIVKVFVDANNDNTPTPSEGVKGVSVKLSLPDGTLQYGTTDDAGEARFNLTGQRTGDVLSIDLVNLYRTQNLIIPASGPVEVQFKFTQPELPGSLP